MSNIIEKGIARFKFHFDLRTLKKSTLDVEVALKNGENDVLTALLLRRDAIKERAERNGRTAGFTISEANSIVHEAQAAAYREFDRRAHSSRR